MADAEAFDAFYRTSRQRLYRTLYALTADAGDAQDAVQEAYARAWQRWSVVGGYADPEAWVRTVARRIVVSRWRRARNALVAHRRAAPDEAVPGPDPQAVLLACALGQLPLPQRTAIVLHHVAGLTVADIARETGAPPGTVKARLARGRRALATLLTPDTAEDLHVG